MARSGVLGLDGILGEGWLSGIVWTMPGLDLAAAILASRQFGVLGEDGTCKWGQERGEVLVALGDP